jgi:ABC-type antimicrobial peptide transport system permease subunit
MIRNYFKTAWRNLMRNKGFSLINVFGLVIGMTCTLLIFLWVRDEISFDRFHKNYDHIYQVIANRDFKNHVFTDRNMVLPMAGELEKKYPDVEHAVVITYRQPHLFQYGDLKLNKSGYNVSEHFFDMFTWKFIKGSSKDILNDPSSLILTQSLATALFGNADPINKMVKIDNDHSMKVVAVVEDPPFNSTLSYDFIMPFNYSDENIRQAMENWQNSSWAVFLQMKPGADMKLMDKNINTLKKEHDKHDEVSTYFTFPMSKWRLYSDFKDGKNTGGMIEYVRLFIIIALGILLIACVNFMNLSTARSEKRSKEVGIRKTLGSNKRQLIMQFFCESIILSFIAFLVSLLAVWLLMTPFNKLVDKHLTIFISSTGFWALAIGIVIFTGIIAGSYPALYLSSFNPVKVLKGTFAAGKEAILPRRILVVGQFAISILLISGTIIIYQQIQHVKDRHIGYDPGNLLMVPSNPGINKNYAVIKQELLKTGLINAVTRSSSPITEVWWKSSSPSWEGKPANLAIIFSGMATDIDFEKTMGLKMLQGKYFSGTPADSAHMILNKAAIEAMNLKNPVGMKMRYGNTDYTVLGVSDNIVMESPFRPVDPMMMYFNPNFSNYVTMRIQPGSEPRKALAAVEKIFMQYNPEVPFDYKFADQEFAKKFISEELINRITNLFAALAILICCIGLAGLASFTIEKRTRELGIRKVLGASVTQLLTLVSKEFLQLVAIAFIIAVPLTWWLMTEWLGNYVYHVDISGWLFALVGFIVLLLALVVVSANTVGTARSNPVKSLRTE